MTPNNKRGTVKVEEPTCQIRVSKRLRESIKISAIKNAMSMEEMANLIISTGIGLLKK